MGQSESTQGSNKLPNLLPSASTSSSSSKVKQHVATAEKTGVLTLKQCGIREIPPQSLALAAKLRNLDLSENKIEHVPPSIGDFSQLRQLALAANRIATLPDEIGTLARLETLMLCENPLAELPLTVASLAQLKKVDLSRCAFVTFPLVLCGLPKLDVLDLSGNRIETMPGAGAESDSAVLARLAVQELNLNSNRLRALNGDALARCARLKVLRVEHNRLALGEFTRALLAESATTLIANEGNPFDAKAFMNADGYEQYMERYTAVKKKMY